MFGAPGLTKRKLQDRGDKWTKDAKIGDQVSTTIQYLYHFGESYTVCDQINDDIRCCTASVIYCSGHL